MGLFNSRNSGHTIILTIENRSSRQLTIKDAYVIGGSLMGGEWIDNVIPEVGSIIYPNDTVKFGCKTKSKTQEAGFQIEFKNDGNNRVSTISCHKDQGNSHDVSANIEYIDIEKRFLGKKNDIVEYKIILNDC